MLRLEFGALCPSMKKQLKGFGLSSQQLNRIQRNIDAINTLRIFGMATDAECKQIERRIAKDIELEIKMLERLL